MLRIKLIFIFSFKKDNTFDISFGNGTTIDSFLSNSKNFLIDPHDKIETNLNNINSHISGSSNRSASSASSASSINTNIIKNENIDFDDQNILVIFFYFQNFSNLKIKILSQQTIIIIIKMNKISI